MFNLRTIGVAAGLAAPIVAFTFILSAIASWPVFSWTNNALSDLGVIEGVTSILFTIGLCGAGILAFIFAVLGLYSFLGKSRLGKVGSGFYAIATVALFCIGVFNENFTPPTHFVVSALFFVLMPFASFILTCAFYRGNQHRLAFFTLAVGLVAALPWILQFTVGYVPNVAIPETISAVTVALWIVVLSRKILKNGQ